MQTRDMPTTIGSQQTDVLLINPCRGAPGTRGSEDLPIPYLDTIAPCYLYDFFHYTFPAEPFYFCQIGGQMRRASISVELLDGLCHRLDMGDMMDLAGRFSTHIHCIAVYHTTLGDSLRLARHIKRCDSKAFTIFGSPYAAPRWQELVTRPEVDFVVVGDGDTNTVDLVRALLHGQSAPPPIPGVARMVDGTPCLEPPRPVASLDALAPPIRDLVPLVKAYQHAISIYSSRGCAFSHCSFCYLPEYQKVSLQPQWRGRSAESVVDEMESVAKTWNVRRVTFVDEDYIGPDDSGVERAVRIARLLQERHLQIKYYINVRVHSLLLLQQRGLLSVLAQSGLDSVFTGFETTSKDRLRRYSKPQSPEQYPGLIKALAQNGIRVNPGLITFDTQMSMDELRDNVALARQLGYYDLFLLSRSMVDLRRPLRFDEKENDESESQRSGMGQEPNRPGFFAEGYDQGIRREHADIVADFRSPEVAVVYQAMRCYIREAFPLYQALCRRPAHEVRRVADSLVEHHYASFDRIADWATAQARPETIMLSEITARVGQDVDGIRQIIGRSDARDVLL